MPARKRHYNILLSSFDFNTKTTRSIALQKTTMARTLPLKQRQIFSYLPCYMELLSGFEPLTSPLPRVCSTN